MAAEWSFNLLINLAYFQSRCRFREGGGGDRLPVQEGRTEGGRGCAEGGRREGVERRKLVGALPTVQGLGPFIRGGAGG